MSEPHDDHGTPAEAPHEHHEHHDAPGTPPAFSGAEAIALHEDDRVAAGHIVKLMVGIFLVGVVLYSIVAFICSRGS